MNSVDTRAIQSMVEQMRLAVGKLGESVNKTEASQVGDTQGVNFSETLKAQLNDIGRQQQQASDLGKRFALGDDSVQLSDVMIAGQKANIQLQTAIQVRNKLVSAYHDIMNMQI